VLVLGVAAPQTGWSLYGDKAVHVVHAVAPAPTVDAGQAGLTVTARLEHLHRDPIADLHAPTLRGPRADGLENTHRLVAGHEGEPGGEGAGVLLVIGAAQPARLYPQDPVIVTHIRQRKSPGHQSPRCLEHEGPHHGHWRAPPTLKLAIRSPTAKVSIMCSRPCRSRPVRSAPSSSRARGGRRRTPSRH